MIFTKKADDAIEQLREIVRNERIAIGLSQKEFSEFIGIKYPTYRNFEQKGTITLKNFLIVLSGLNKYEDFEKFMDGFEFKSGSSHSRAVKKKNDHIEHFEPIIKPSQKKIALDKEIFGSEAFYSVENGHVYDVSKFIKIMLKNYNDRTLMLLLKYFGEKRLKPYVLQERDIGLLKKFNKHVKYMKEKLHAR
ncbi:helix-turn-helix domain-containing protein [Sulfurimonas sp.]